MLAPVLATGARAERVVFNADEARRKRSGDVDLAHVGREAKMPWQTDGRRWHTQDRVAHNGRPCRWEGAALEQVIDRLEASADLQPANWNDRSVVEVTAAQVNGSQSAGLGTWFLHAMTADEWLLTLKFRVRRNTFKADALSRRLSLKPLDELDELPIYGRDERVKVRNARGPWQEVSITIHWQREIDTPEFHAFLDEALRSYLGQTHKAKLNPNDLTPWKVLGRKWHLARKGFPPGKRVAWEPTVLERLLDLCTQADPDSDIDWQGKETITFRHRGTDEAWAVLHTKRRAGVDLSLFVPAGQATLGRIAHLGATRKLTPGRNGQDVIQVRFTTAEQVQGLDLRDLMPDPARSR